MKTKIETSKTLIAQQNKIIAAINKQAERVDELLAENKVYAKFDMLDHVKVNNTKITMCDKCIERLFNSLKNCNDKLAAILN